MYKLENNKQWTDKIKKAFKKGITRAYLMCDGVEISADNYLMSVDYGDEKADPQDGRFIGKAICRSIDIKLNNKANALNLENKEVEYYLGAKVDGEFVYIKYGKFIVQKPENQEVNEETIFEALDYMSKFNVAYNPTVKYPAKIIDIVQDICNQCSVELGNTNFRNADKVIEANPFTNAEQCREVIKSIAKVSFSSAYIWQDNKLYFGFDVINDSVTEELTVNDYFETEKNNQIKPITVITLRSGEVAASGQSIRNENLIKQYGENELIVEEDYFAFTDTLRQSFLQEANVLFGLTYHPISIDLEGSVYLSFNDVIKITNLNNEVIKTYCLNNTHTYNGVLYNTVSTPTLTETEEKYTYKDEDKTKRTKTAIEIDKANKKITQIVEDVSGHETRIAKTETDINGIKNTVSETTEIVDELSKDVQVYSADLDIYSIVIPTDGKQYPFEDKSYRVNFYTYFKGKQVNSIVTTASSNEGITCDINSYINLSVKKETKISNLTNEFIINFIYEDEDKNPYTVSKKIVITLGISEIPKSFLNARIDESVKLEESGNNKLKALNKLEGRDVEQETREGYNLIDSESLSNQYNVESIENGEIKSVSVTTALFVRFFINRQVLSAGTYTVKFKAKTTSSLTNSKFASMSIYPYGGTDSDRKVMTLLANPYLTTNYQDYKATITLNSATDINRLYFQTLLSSPSSTEYKLYIKDVMLYEGIEDKEYEAYGKAPTPNFPSEVKTVTGNIQTIFSNKNLLPNNLETQTINGITATVNNDKSITFKGTSTGTATFKLLTKTKNFLKKGVNYVLSTKNNVPANVYFRLLDGENTNVYKQIYNENNVLKFTYNEDFTSDTIQSFVYFGSAQVGSTFDFTIYPQLEIGEEKTEYIPHQSQVKTISLGDIELCKIGDYADYIYKADGKWFKKSYVGKYIFTGNEKLSETTNANGLTYYGGSLFTNGDYISYSNMLKVATVSSYIWNATEYEDVFQYSANSINRINILSTISNLTDFKARLKELYDNGTPMYMVYVLATPTDTEILNARLIAQLNALENAQLYEGITNISITGDNLTPIADIDYWTWYKGNEGDKGDKGDTGATGAAGKDGISTYFYVRYSANSNGNPMTTSPSSTTQYMGVASTTSSTAPTSYSAYTWSKIKGEQGTSGTPGTAGKDGKTTYLHIKYSEDGINFTPADDDFALGEKPSAYIGQYTDFTQADSSNFADYSWYKFTQNIDAELNQMQSQISQNTTDIENKYQDVIGKMDNFATEDNLVAIEQRVETIEKDNSYNINIIKDIQVNGVSKVKTETGYMFDEDGLKIEKTGAKVKSKLDEAGIEIKDATGSSDESLLYAGYDEELGETIVKSKNMTVEKYLVVGKYSRMEDFTDSDGNLGTGMFWIGG